MIYRSGPQAQIRMAYHVWRYLRLKMKTNLLMLWIDDLLFRASGSNQDGISCVEVFKPENENKLSAYVMDG